jgi:hypothetical protein
MRASSPARIVSETIRSCQHVNAMDLRLFA